MAEAKTRHQIMDERMGMRCVCAFSHLTSLPGVALYRPESQSVRLDRYACQLLGLEGGAARTMGVWELLHYIGHSAARRFLAGMRLLQDGRPQIKSIVDGQSPNNTNLRFTIAHGPYAGNVLYARLTAFYSGPNKLQGVLFNFSRLIPNRLALIPEILSFNSDFDWLVQDNILMISSNYYQRLGYVRQDQDLVLDFDAWLQYLVHPQDRHFKDLLKPVLSGPESGDKFDVCFRTRKLDGAYIWTRSVGTVIARNSDGQALRVIGHNCYINEVTDSFERLRTRVYTDVLTGLKNRTYFTAHLQDFLSPQWQPLGIFFFDATALKLYNDYLGHVSGDKLLFSIARLLQDSLEKHRDKELIRISGDELIAILPHCSHEQMQRQSAELLEALAQRNAQAPLRMPVFFSHGSTCLDLNAMMYYELFWQSLPPSLQRAFARDALGLCLSNDTISDSRLGTEEALRAGRAAAAAEGADISDWVHKLEQTPETSPEEARPNQQAIISECRALSSRLCCPAPLQLQKQLQLRWEQWQPLQEQQQQAAELFFQAVQQADVLMQRAKRRNHDEHYGIIKQYLERVLHRHIDLTDKRLFAPASHGPQALA